MFILNRKRYLSSLVLTVITLMTATACSTTQQVKETNNISIERVDSDKATIWPSTLTADAGLISPGALIGVGPKNRQSALPGGQYAIAPISTVSSA